MDGVNRDIALERRFRDYATGPKGVMGHVASLWDAFRIMEKSDLCSLQSDRFVLAKGIVSLAWMHWAVMDTEKEFYHYVRWFMENRLVNTGKDGRAKCEMSEHFKVETKGIIEP